MEHVAMLYPFWGKNPEDPQDPSSGRYDRYVELGRDIFTMIPVLEEADLAVLPASWERVCQDPRARDLAGRFVEQVRRTGKRLVVFYWSDAYDVVPLENASVFRTSFHRSTRKPHEFAMPAWSEDLVEKYLDGHLPLRDKQENPVVGFCGYGRIRWDLKNILSWGASRLGLKETKSLLGHVCAPGFAAVGQFPRKKQTCHGDAFGVEPVPLCANHQRFKPARICPQPATDCPCVRNGTRTGFMRRSAVAGSRFLSIRLRPVHDFAIDWKILCLHRRGFALLKSGRVSSAPAARFWTCVSCRQLWEKWLFRKLFRTSPPLPAWKMPRRGFGRPATGARAAMGHDCGSHCGAQRGRKHGVITDLPPFRPDPSGCGTQAIAIQLT
jgi:hypothetical protein